MADPVPEAIAEQMALDRQQLREERQALVAIPAADLATMPQRMTFMPQSMGEAMQLATMMSRSNFVPAHLRGKDGDCLAIVMQASRWGMDPFAVANKSYFAKEGAPPAFESQLINAVVNSSGALAGRLRIAFDGDGEKLRCTVRGFLRADPDDEKVKTQHIARVRTRNSPLWKDDPEQQLGYYTTRAWARLHCPEVLLGVYTPDELEDELRSAVRPPRPTREAFTDSDAEGSRDHDDNPEVSDSSAVKHEEGEPARDLPADAAEWRLWADDVVAKAGALTDTDALNALWAEHRTAIDAAPATDRDHVTAALTDRAAELATGGGDA